MILAQQLLSLGQVTEKTTKEEASKYLSQIRTAENNNYNYNNNKNNNDINFFIILTICIIATILIILLPLFSNKKKED